MKILINNPLDIFAFKIVPVSTISFKPIFCSKIIKAPIFCLDRDVVAEIISFIICSEL